MANLIAREELDGVPLDLAVVDDQAALAASPLAATDGPHVDLRLPGSLQEGRPRRDRHFPTIRKKMNANACHALGFPLLLEIVGDPRSLLGTDLHGPAGLVLHAR